MADNVVTMAEPVDADGNILFNFSEGINIPIREYTEAGTEVDISGLPYFFNASKGSFRVPLSEDGVHPMGRRLQLTPEQLRLIPTPCLFSITDESNTEIPISIWEGLIIERTM